MKQKGSVKYYPKDDVLYVAIWAGEEAKSVEIEPWVTAELDKNGEIIGIEILEASQYLRKLIQTRLEPQLRHRAASSASAHELTRHGTRHSRDAWTTASYFPFTCTRVK